MKPLVVFPFHDPDGFSFAHLQAITPILKEIFAGAVLGITPPTGRDQPENAALLAADPFFRTIQTGSAPVGEQFHTLYRFACQGCPPEQVLHLCFIDRLAFALQTTHRGALTADLRGLEAAGCPLLFIRSPLAWETHPGNYREIEGWATQLGQLVWGRKLDFAWCHLALQAGQLESALASARQPGLEMMASIVIHHRDVMRTREVDWLAWEDPFFLQENPLDLKRSREASPAETRKRLGYVLPILRLIEAHMS